MGKWIRRIIMLVLLGVFLFSGVSIITVLHQYKISDQLYGDIAERYTLQVPDKGGEAQAPTEETDVPGSIEIAPITVDFEGLWSMNEDVIGWIYCEDTPINYPIAHGKDNNQYLRHSLDGSYNSAGTIFTEEENRPGFVDSNMIIYGHNMNDGSMFAVLDEWKEQEYYESHPVMWLLTPEQDYKIVLFSGYTTPATSDTYTVFEGPCKELDTYLENGREQSDFTADVELDGNAQYVLLSTCSYVFDNARYVLHGKLVPVDSAGGEPLR